MSLTLPEFASVCAEVYGAAVPSGVQKVFERDEHAVVLQLRGAGVTHYLLLDTTPGATRFHLVDSKPQQPPEPSAFTMLLRKHLIGTGLKGIEQIPGDRILRLEFGRAGEDARERELIVELTGRHGGMFLLANGNILGAQTRTDGERDLRPGAPWEPPPPPPESVATRNRFADVEGSVSDAIAEHYDTFVERKRLDELRTRLASGLKREAKRLRRLRKNIEGDLEKAEAAQEFKRFGELLQSAYGRDMPRGAASVRVPDYYAEGAPEVEIELDPARSLQQNIERYFHEYRRLNAATDRIETRLLETMEKLEAVEAAREKLRDLEDAELDEFCEEVSEEGLTRARQRQRRRSESKPVLPYREFQSKRGAAILVGRNAKKNDELTTRHARGRDIWLHARDWPGSHVVLRMSKDDEPDGEDLLDAAVLAAHFSGGKGDSLVDVTYTRAKHVRKPKGAAAGLVTVAGGSTIAVAPDPGRLERLLSTEDAGS